MYHMMEASDNMDAGVGDFHVHCIFHHDPTDVGEIGYYWGRSNGPGCEMCPVDGRDEMRDVASVCESKVSSCVIDWLIDRSIEWLIDRLIDLFIG